MEKSRLLVLFLIVLSVSFISSIHAEDINLGTYDLNNTENKVISTPQDLDTPPEPPTEARSFSVSSMSKSNFADNYIISKLGQTYFNEHFNFLDVEKRDFVQFYNYNFVYGDYNTKLFLAVSNNEVIEGVSHIIKSPKEIIFTDKSALEKTSELGLSEPKTISLVYSDKQEALAWRVDWEHIPTQEERINKSISGYLISTSNGEILETYIFEIDPKTSIDSINKQTTKFILPLILGIIFVGIVILIVKRRK